jgi:hypothetical protein
MQTPQFYLHGQYLPTAQHYNTTPHMTLVDRIFKGKKKRNLTAITFHNSTPIANFNYIQKIQTRNQYEY